MKIAELIDKYISERVDFWLSKQQIPDTEYVATDNLGEMIEKLVILHIRTWMLEDLITGNNSDANLADIKRKIDTCFKIKRPKLVQAINALVDDAIINNKSIREDSVKLYNGVDL
jgi:hypothetical protein